MGNQLGNQKVTSFSANWLSVTHCRTTYSLRGNQSNQKKDYKRPSMLKRTWKSTASLLSLQQLSLPFKTGYFGYRGSNIHLHKGLAVTRFDFFWLLSGYPTGYR